MIPRRILFWQTFLITPHLPTSITWNPVTKPPSSRIVSSVVYVVVFPTVFNFAQSPGNKTTDCNFFVWETPDCERTNKSFGPSKNGWRWFVQNFAENGPSVNGNNSNVFYIIED